MLSQRRGMNAYSDHRVTRGYVSFGNQRVGVVERREAQTPAAGEAAWVKNGTNHDTLLLQKRRIKHQRSILLFMSDPNIELAPKKWTSRIDRLWRTGIWGRNRKVTVRI